MSKTGPRSPASILRPLGPFINPPPQQLDLSFGQPFILRRHDDLVVVHAGDVLNQPAVVASPWLDRRSAIARIKATRRLGRRRSFSADVDEH